MRGFFGGVIFTLVALAGGAYAAISLGWFPLGADNAPGALERSLAHIATHKYLDKNAPKQDNPFQPTPANLIEGARTYEAHCAVCHGGALTRESPLHNKFSPSAPQLVKRVPHDPDGEFWLITKHGFRLTGMPAWDGILTDDEIWKVVGFISHSDKLPPEVQAAWRAAANLASKP